MPMRSSIYAGRMLVNQKFEGGWRAYSSYSNGYHGDIKEKEVIWTKMSVGYVNAGDSTMH